MKRHVGLILCAAAALLSSFAFSQDPAPKDPRDHKIELLEKDIASNRERIEALASQLADTKALLAKSVEYIGREAKSAKALAATLDESEQAGFTFGINPDSRHILLSGWREHLSELQKNVPGAPSAPSAAEKSVQQANGDR